jgi:class 3 adenylate cyclase
MVYLGWPRAHEDDAERAIRAGLEIVDAVKNVQGPAPLLVRIGIATGAVVVGETAAGDASVPKAAVGETPNRAARLQGLAGADEIMISPTTRRLAGGAFEYADLGEHTLKVIVEPVRVWRVAGVAAGEGRFEAVHGDAQLTPLVGRDEEIALLLRRWRQAAEGEGQVVLLR